MLKLNLIELKLMSSLKNKQYPCKDLIGSCAFVTRISLVNDFKGKYPLPMISFKIFVLLVLNCQFNFNAILLTFPLRTPHLPILRQH